MDPILSFNKRHASRTIPAIKTGDTVRVHQKITEGEKERVQIFEGLVIKISSGNGVSKTFTVRKTTNGIGVEKIFPFMLPAIEKLEIVKRGKTRRSKLYYIRDKQPKEARLKDMHISDEQKAALSYDKAAEEAEMKALEEKKQAEEAAKEAKKAETEKKEVAEEKTEKKEENKESADKKEEKK